MKRPWWQLAVSVALMANVVSLAMGGTHPTFPDTAFWMTAATVTALLGAIFVAHPTRLLMELTTVAVATVAGSRAVGAIFWNPQLWSKFGGGSIWTLTFIYVLVAHKRWAHHAIR